MIMLLLCTELTQNLVFCFKKNTEELKTTLVGNSDLSSFPVKKKITKLHVVYEKLKWSGKPDEK